ncbi:MAG TPA: hypothetical protein DCO79_09380, partial [Spirochaeta sp.]|nr:hypothetical protein [Spirochaeta sp.]
MEKIKVQQVTTRKQLKQFVYLPKYIYADDELWVPPLWLMEKTDHKPGANPVLGRSEHALFLAYVNGKPRGRIIAYIDPRYNKHFNS